MDPGAPPPRIEFSRGTGGQRRLVVNHLGAASVIQQSYAVTRSVKVKA